MAQLPPEIALRFVLRDQDARRTDASRARLAGNHTGRLRLAYSAFRYADRIGRPCRLDGRSGRFHLAVVDGTVVVACRPA